MSKLDDILNAVWNQGNTDYESLDTGGYKRQLYPDEAKSQIKELLVMLLRDSLDKAKKDNYMPLISGYKAVNVIGSIIRNELEEL